MRSTTCSPTRASTLGKADYYDRYLGFDDVGVFRALGAERGLKWTTERVIELVARKAVRMEALERDVSVLFPGAEDAIRRAAAVVPVAIASGALGMEIRRVLDRAHLTPCFQAIVAAEDTPASKPAPDPYLKAVALLSAHVGEVLPPGSCVAIEDSHWGLESARAAGLRTVGVTNTYDAAALGMADLVIPSLDGLDLRRARSALLGTVARRRSLRYPERRSILKDNLIRSFTHAALSPDPDLAIAALMIARVEYPKLDAGPYLDRLDALGRARRAPRSRAAHVDRATRRRASIPTATRA